jgi:CheY-like chemotaxis protein
MTGALYDDQNVDMPRRLLIVDDHDGFRVVARTMMELAGFEVSEAVDGASAVEAAVTDRPTIVLLDVHLPDVDGFEVAHRLDALPDAPRVVLVSSRPWGDVRRRLASSPAIGFLTKADLSAEAILALVG